MTIQTVFNIVVLVFTAGNMAAPGLKFNVREALNPAGGTLVEHAA